MDMTLISWVEAPKEKEIKAHIELLVNLKWKKSPAQAVPLNQCFTCRAQESSRSPKRSWNWGKSHKNVSLRLFSPFLSNQPSSVRCRGSIICSCHVTSAAEAQVCTAHRKTRRTGCQCKNPRCFHFCGHVPSSQGRPQRIDHKRTCKLTFA